MRTLLLALFLLGCSENNMPMDCNGKQEETNRTYIECFKLQHSDWDNRDYIHNSCMKYATSLWCKPRVVTVQKEKESWLTKEEQELAFGKGGIQKRLDQCAKERMNLERKVAKLEKQIEELEKDIDQGQRQVASFVDCYNWNDFFINCQDFQGSSVLLCEGMDGPGDVCSQNNWDSYQSYRRNGYVGEGKHSIEAEMERQ